MTLVARYKTEDVKSSKVQATLSGYTAWVVQRLTEAKRQTTADVVKYLLDRWVDDNDEFLERYGIRREEFAMRESEVVTMPNANRSA
jgi:hypothetical protein